MMSYIKKEKIEEIKEKADIVSVVSDYLSIKKSGRYTREIVLFIMKKHLLFLFIPKLIVFIVLVVESTVIAYLL